MAFEEMRAPSSIRCLVDGIRVRHGRGHIGRAISLDLVLRRLRQLAPHQSLGHVEGRRDQNEAGELITSAFGARGAAQAEARSTHPWRSR